MTAKKLIEVALPLEAINVASAKEKSIRHGHPSTMHLWWARRPLAACRAVLFASLVDDPSARPDEFPTEAAQEVERQRLFRIIEELVKWENTTNEAVLNAARAEIMRSTNGNPPPVLDPFCGGGSIPLEAQRLGLEAHGSDLNPVAVLITKALIEIPPKFAGRPPVHPDQPKALMAREWRGAQGLAEDVRYYGKWMRDEAERRIGHLYPRVMLPRERGGGEATVIAWLWARAVTCPNPACRASIPMVRTFWLSTKPDRKAWLEPVIDRQSKTIRFKTQAGEPAMSAMGTIDAGTSVLNAKGKKMKATFRCLTCGIGTVKGDYIDKEAAAGRMYSAPLAIVADGGKRGRIYIPFDELQHQSILDAANSCLQDPTINALLPTEAARGTFASNAQGRSYNFQTFADYFTPRQLAALATFSNLVAEVQSRLKEDTVAASVANGCGIDDYANAVSTYLGMAVSRLSDICNSLCRWESSKTQVRNLFGRQAIPMMWDYAEPNVFASTAGDFGVSLGNLVKALETTPRSRAGVAKQVDAMLATDGMSPPLVSTDPPYYGNVAYADLADFFYVWLKRSLRNVYPELFSTMLGPKSQELVATPFKFDGDWAKARDFFEEGLGKAFAQMRRSQHPDYPLSVYYAYKQTEVDTDGDDDDEGGPTLLASTGWETMLEGLLKAGFTISGTWPIRSELSNRPVASGTNALASSIVLVCRPRPVDAKLTTRRDFLAALKRELPTALKNLQHGNVAPVDLAQASIGLGMAIFSRYSKVVESDGKPMRVRTALQIINQTLDEVLTEQESEYDADTRWALAWFEQHTHDEGLFGQADVLARARNTSVVGLVGSGIVASRIGKVRLLRRDELAAGWNPATDTRLTVWETTQQLIRALDQGGEVAAAAILRQVGALGETARDLAYRLYTTCERKGWAAEALAYNSLVVAWPQLTGLAASPAEGEQLALPRA